MAAGGEVLMRRERIAQQVGGVVDGGVVCVSRDGDDRIGQVAAADVRDPVIATVSSGRKRPLPGPMLAVCADCTAIMVPAGVDFGHDCKHGEGPHSIRVVVHEDGTDREVFGGLVAAAECLAQMSSATGPRARAVRRALRKAAAIHGEES
jgi:hypothetical protein